MTHTTSPNERFVFMGNRVKASVETIRTYHLILDTGHHLDLFQTLYVPSISRNLISLSKLDTVGYSFKFGNGCCSLFKHNHFIGSGVLCDGLYKLKLDNLFVETLLTMHHNIGREKYFITFINDFSCYGYIYLLHEKSQSVDALEVFINEVERQLDRKAKIVRSDRGGEYYGRYDEMGQHPGPFAKFLEKRDIFAQYTMPGTPQQNDVAERRNRTLMDMVRSM